LTGGNATRAWSPSARRLLLRCNAETRRGGQCRNEALVGGDRCYAHRRLVDEQALAQLVGMLRAGNYLDVAAKAAGVPVDELPAELVERLEVARAEGEARGIATIAQAARSTWQAAAWLLERQYPERWGRPAQRADEKPPAPVAGTDSLDELAGRRVQRRAGR